MRVWIVYSSDTRMQQWRDIGSVNWLMIFDVASSCWEAHIWMNILVALVEARDKYIVLNIIISLEVQVCKCLTIFSFSLRIRIVHL